MTNKTLIVEDQRFTLEALEYAVNTVFPKYVPNFEKGNYDVARSFRDAQANILEEGYEIVLLDHRMPFEDQGDLEKTDFDSFSASLQNIGYSLVPIIKNRNYRTLVVGTSSLSDEELNGFGRPDFSIRKGYDESVEDLEKMFKEILGK